MLDLDQLGFELVRDAFRSAFRGVATLNAPVVYISRFDT